MKIERLLNNRIWEEIKLPVRITDDKGDVIFQSEVIPASTKIVINKRDWK